MTYARDRGQRTQACRQPAPTKGILSWKLLRINLIGVARSAKQTKCAELYPGATPPSVPCPG